MSCQNAEAESLKTRLKRYADYDEVKRELEIMKVNAFVSCKGAAMTDINILVCRVCRCS